MAAIIKQIVSVPLNAKSAWDKFWFSPGDPTALGVMRWLVGGMLLYTHVVWGINLEAFFGPNGWSSPEALAFVQDGQLVPSFWWYVPEAWMYHVHYLCVAILFLFWIGCATRVTSVLSMVITVSYCYRAHMANFGLDQINAILCLYLCIGPSGATLSFDRLFKVWRRRRRALNSGTKFTPVPISKSTSARLAVRLVQIHFCVIYAYAGLSKLQGPAWWSGEATWLAFANLEYQSFDMTWISSFPWIADIMTHTTILWEVSFAALIWVRPVRPYVLAIGFLMHAGIGGAMGMWTFGLIMIFGHVAFWPKQSIAWVASLVPSAERLLGVADADSLHPALVYVDRTVRRRIDSLRYFLNRGYRCLAIDDTEAHVVCDATGPDAVVICCTDMDDDEIEGFHHRHCEREDHEPLFMVLTKRQSERLNRHIRAPKSFILSGRVSLGHLRRQIHETLEPVHQKMTIADSPSAT